MRAEAKFRMAAKNLAKAIGADLYEILPASRHFWKPMTLPARRLFSLPLPGKADS